LAPGAIRPRSARTRRTRCPGMPRTCARSPRAARSSAITERGSVSAATAIERSVERSIPRSE
jgi:hypothetical protein